MSSLDPFSIAKKALQMTGQFGTPPTPEVFEVWYRFVEGNNEAMNRDLRYAVEELKAVSLEQLHAIYEEHYSKKGPDDIEASEVLMDEIDNIRMFVGEQKAAGSSFNDSLEEIGESLTQDSVSASQVVSCVASLVRETTTVQDRFEEVSQKLSASQAQIESLQNDLANSQKAMMTDHLTGIGNRRFFDTLIKKMTRCPIQEGAQIYLAIIDLDHFKNINDSYGHDAGDQVLKFVTSRISQLRPDASISRLGGDEFSAFIRCQNREEAVHFADEIRSYFASQEFLLKSTQQSLGGITLSMGLARLRSTDDETSWFDRADRLLYQAKVERDNALVEPSVS